MSESSKYQLLNTQDGLQSVLMETTSDAVLITDEQHFVTAANTAFVHRTGYRLKDLQARPWTYIGERGESTALLDEIEGALVRSRRWQRTIWIRRRSGEITQVALSVSCFCDASGSSRLVVMSDPGEARAALGCDPLTGLRDSSHIRALLRERLLHPHEGLKPLLMLVAIDRFEEVNTRFGWSFADLVLKLVALRLRDRVASNGTVARVSGDRFAILHHGIADPSEATAWAETLLAHVAEPLETQQHKLTLTASIGVVIAPDDGRDVDTLLRQVDSAMRLAKEAGRDTWQRAPSLMQGPKLVQETKSDELRAAIRDGQFEIYYQPCVSARNGKIVSVEALLRWQHPEKGSLTPSYFLDAAERAGLLVELGDWTLRSASAQLLSWREQSRPDMRLSINLSLSQLLDEWLLERIEQVLVANELPASAIEVELSAAIFFEHHSRLVQVLKRLSLLGVGIALDDFGQRAFDFTTLTSAPFSCVKIDHSLIRDLPSDERVGLVVGAIIAMSRSLDLRVIGEGVETSAQIEKLRALECDEAQGYFFGRPMPAREVSLLLRHKQRLR